MVGGARLVQQDDVCCLACTVPPQTVTSPPAGTGPRPGLAAHLCVEAPQHRHQRPEKCLHNTYFCTSFIEIEDSAEAGEVFGWEGAATGAAKTACRAGAAGPCGWLRTSPGFTPSPNLNPNPNRTSPGFTRLRRPSGTCEQSDRVEALNAALNQGLRHVRGDPVTMLRVPMLRVPMLRVPMLRS